MNQQKLQLKLPNSLPLFWVAAGKNVGFSPATNLGFRARPADFFICLNDDTEVDPAWLTELLSTQKRSSADMVASSIYLGDHETLDSQGFTFAWRGRAEALRGAHSHVSTLPDHWLKNKDLLTTNTLEFWQEPFGPDAAACLYTQKLIQTIGPFRDDFFAYLEDVELPLRARKAGFHCALASDAIVYHHKHSTSKHFSSFKARQDATNWWRIVLTYPGNAWQRFAFLILIERTRNLSGWLKSIKTFTSLIRL